MHPRGSYYRCLPTINQQKCDQPYSPVKALDGQLATLYKALQQPPEVIELMKAEAEELVERQKRLAHRDLARLRRTIAGVEAKEIRLLDEKLAGRVDPGIYEKLAKRYRDKRQQAETRLAQLDVNYEAPLSLLGQCGKVASVLSELHERFDFEQRKNLLRSVFRKIEVEDRTIVGAALNPPFDFFFDETLRNLVRRSSC
jgi:hypothetical protein